MKTLKIIIEKSEDHIAAYAPDVWGVSGAGNNPSEAKKAAMESIELVKKYNSPESIPEILQGEYLVEYQFDGDS